MRKTQKTFRALSKRELWCGAFLLHHFSSNLLYVQEVVTQPKILNRTILSNKYNSCDLKLFCSVN